jgi:hypothetical protein
MAPLVAALLAIAAGATAAGAPAGRASACSALGASRAASLRVRHVARADVDGDGQADAAWIGVGRTRRIACRFFLAVRTARGTFTVRFGDPTVEAVNGPPPALAALAQIDGRRGREVVVEVVRGASMSSFALFGFHGGRLIRFRHAGRVPSTLSQDVFLAGGPVTIGMGLECEPRRPGVLVQEALLSGWNVPSRATEERYLFAGGRFRLVGRRVRSLSPARAERYELGFFDGCSPLFTRDRM